MDWIINFYARAEGLTVWIMDVLPLLGAVGGLLGVASIILLRASITHSPAEAWHALHPTAQEFATFSLSLGVLRAHFKHNITAKAVAEVVPTKPS